MYGTLAKGSTKAVLKLTKEGEEATRVIKTEGKIAKIQWSKIPKPDLNKITNPNLKSVLAQDYRELATIGNGSTADAIRSELAT